MEQLLGKVLAIAFVVSDHNVIKNALPTWTPATCPFYQGSRRLSRLGQCIGVLSTLEIPVRYLLLDYLVTGVVISRGSNIVHDLAKTLSSAS